MASKLRVNQIEPVNGIPTGGGGGIIQMKFASFTGTQTFTSAGKTDITNLSVSLTPHYTTSKLWITGLVSFGQEYDSSQHLHIDVNGTEVGMGDAAGSRTRAHSGGGYNNENQAHYQIAGVPVNWIHSPASTSAQTVKLQWSQTDTSGTSAFINRSEQDTDAVWMARYVSTLTVFEVSG
jgi:hypothetical protein